MEETLKIVQMSANYFYSVLQSELRDPAAGAARESVCVCVCGNNSTGLSDVSLFITVFLSL